jgi:DNA-binding IclR family transcriptional regulator
MKSITQAETRPTDTVPISEETVPRSGRVTHDRMIDGIQKNNAAPSRYVPVVPAVQQGAEILLCLAKSPAIKMRLTDICNQVGIHKSKGYSILNTLKNFGFIEKDPQTKTYSLGPALLFLSGRVLDTVYNQQAVAPFLEYLAQDTQSTAFFGLIIDKYLFVIDKHEVDSGITITIRLGYRFPFTYGTHGKVLMAFLPKAEREKILASEKLWFNGDTSPVNMQWLKEEFARCRQRGFSQDVGEVDPRYNSIAAPVFGIHGKLVASIFIVGVFDEQLVETYGRKVAECARHVSYALGADVDQIYEKIKKEEL